MFYHVSASCVEVNDIVLDRLFLVYEASVDYVNGDW